MPQIIMDKPIFAGALSANGDAHGVQPRRHVPSVAFTATYPKKGDREKAMPNASQFDWTRSAYKPSKALQEQWASEAIDIKTALTKGLIQQCSNGLLSVLPLDVYRILETGLLYRGNRGQHPLFMETATSRPLAEFQTDKRWSASERKLLAQIKEYTFSSFDPYFGELSSAHTNHKAWFFPPTSGKPTILFSPGQTAKLSNIRFLLPWMQNGYGVFVYDYPGYGDSKGLTTEPWLYATAERATQKLEQLGVPKSKQIIWGYSMGGAPTAYLASKYKFKAVVLQSTMSSFPEVTQHTVENRWGIASWLLPLHRHTITQFPIREFLKTNTTPTLLIHGQKDKEIPWQQTLTNEQALPRSTKHQVKLFESGTHYMDLSDLAPHVNSFLATC